MQDFAAIDFELANFSPASICSVGVVVVRNGKIAERFYSLVRPKPNSYNRYCVRVHGLTEKDTRDASPFPIVWRKVAEIIGELPLVAHNCNCDRLSLKAAFKLYKMKYPNYVFHCTLKAAQEKLPESASFKLSGVAEQCGYKMENQHNALADAEACAAIALKLL